MRNNLKTGGVASVFVILSLVMSTTYAQLEKLGPSSEKVEQYRQRLEQNKNNNVNVEVNDAMKARAKKMHEYSNSKEFQESVNENKTRLQLAYPEIFGEAPESAKVKEKKPEYEGDRVFVFISKSIPEETLRNYISDLAQLPQATAVLKGFVGGVQKMQPTIQFIGDLMKEDRDCKMPDCDFNSANIVVDPIIFQRLKIDRVPAIAYIEDYKRTGYCSEGLDDGAKMNKVHVVYGDVPLKFALEYIDRKSPSKKLKTLIRKIKS